MQRASLFLFLLFSFFSNPVFSQDKSFYIATQPTHLTGGAITGEIGYYVHDEHLITGHFLSIDMEDNYFFDFDIFLIGINGRWFFSPKENEFGSGWFMNYGLEIYNGKLTIFGSEYSGTSFYPNLAAGYQWLWGNGIGINLSSGIGLAKGLLSFNLMYHF
jgi:hypothetical protein